jgi:hypothetical protein
MQQISNSPPKTFFAIPHFPIAAIPLLSALGSDRSGLVADLRPTRPESNVPTTPVIWRIDILAEIDSAG